MQEGEGAAVDVGAFPAIGPGHVQFTIDLPDEVLEARGSRSQRVEPVQHVAGRQGDRRIRIGRDRLDPLHRPVFTRRIGGHCDRPAIQAAHECRDEVEARGIQQQHPLASHSLMRQPCPHRPRLPIEFGVGEIQLLVFTIHEKREGAVVRAVGSPLAQQIHDRGSN